MFCFWRGFQINYYSFLGERCCFFCFENNVSCCYGLYMLFYIHIPYIPGVYSVHISGRKKEAMTWERGERGRRKKVKGGGGKGSIRDHFFFITALEANPYQYVYMIHIGL